MNAISIHSLAEIGVNEEHFYEECKALFSDLEPDLYLERQLRKEYLQEKSTLAPDVTLSEWLEYYSLGNTSQSIQDCILDLTTKDRERFHRIKTYRFRAMSSAIATKTVDGEIELSPVAAEPVVQKQDLLPEGDADVRTASRKFPEIDWQRLPTSLYNCTRFFASKVLHNHPSGAKTRVELHFTKIVCNTEGTVSNSPEGLHQDGVPFIVSALVVERTNVDGGTSRVFTGPNEENLILACQLQEGQALFQPDEGTNLWHMVDPIKPKNEAMLGVRSTIGFDFYLPTSPGLDKDASSRLTS